MLGLHRLLGIGDVATEIAVADVNVDIGGQLSVLGPDRGRATRRLDPGDLPERHRAAGRHRHQDVVANGLRIVPEVPRVAHVDAEAPAAFHGRSHRLAAERGGDDVLDVLDHDAVARERRTVRRDVEVIAADPTLRISR